MKPILFLLLPACLTGQIASDLLSGTWINENQQTGGITQVVVRRDGERMMVHAWGACQPTDCDWGEAEAEPWNGIPLVIWKQGFATTRMQLVLQPDNRLVLIYREEYHDESGRSDLGHAEFFSRPQPKQETPDSAAGRALLKSVAATYRSLAEARFESTETVDRLTG